MNKAIADNTGQPVAGAFFRFFPAMPVTLFSLFSLLRSCCRHRVFRLREQVQE
ncbi:MAG: hypothetical protein LBR26_13815 [Prevotella sp.]|nr:hypothetical protein [Prevotella sp.]